MKDVLHVVLTGAYCNTGTPRENGEHTVLEEGHNISYILFNITVCIFAIVQHLHELVYAVLSRTCSISCPPRQNSQTRRQK